MTDLDAFLYNKESLNTIINLHEFAIILFLQILYIKNLHRFHNFKLCIAYCIIHNVQGKLSTLDMFKWYTINICICLLYQ